MASVTIIDVAKEANVSIKTVSRVLNDEQYVKDSTREAILVAIESLGYRPNKVARSLSRSRTETIGIVVSNIANNFIGQVIRGIEDITRETNYSFIVCNTDEQLEQENNYLDLLLRHRVDGIIAAAASQKWEALGEAEKQSTPIVFLDRRFEGMEGSYVGVDNVDGAYKGTSHLIECGHKKIGVISGHSRLSSMRGRITGYRRAMSDNSLPINPEWIVESNLQVDEARQAARKILSLPDPPSALFANTNILALGALLALKDLDLRCPSDVAIVGFDDHPWAEVCDPPLTVICQPAREIGQTAAKILLGLVDGETSIITQIRLRSELIIRQSSCKKRSAE